jgi:hypothetical protein
MVVEIANGRKDTWYENKVGWKYEVEKEKKNLWFLVSETKYHLWSLYLSPEDVVIIEAD